VGATQTTCNRL